MRKAVSAGIIWISLAGFASFGAEADAIAISANIQGRHMPFGTILDPIFASADSTQIVGYTRCGDSAIWTGHYLAAEAFRYNVTRSPEALSNVTKALAGLKAMIDVTGTDLLARCVVGGSSPFAPGIQSEEAHNGIYTNASTGSIWVGNTSRDQYSGAMLGLAVAYDMIDDAGIRTASAGLITRLVDFLRAHSWNVVMPDGSTSTTFVGRGDQILSFLQVAAHVNPGRFVSVYNDQRGLLSLLVTIPIALEAASDGSYFKFNLDYINLFNLVRLNQSSTNGVYRSAYNVLRDHTAAHQNALFDVVDAALNGPDAARDAEMQTLLQSWLERSDRDNYLDASGSVAVCGGEACRPVPVPLRPPTDYLWQRSPFQLAAGGSGRIESAGIDYILPYWMARYYRLLPAVVVQSAASGSGRIAPDSLASIFGSNLAAGTMNINDSAGLGRAASLTYVSPAQINFIVPKGVAPGLATVTIANGAATTTATAVVKNVAPALFSMSGNGTGVAAATAVRAQAGSSQLQSPVPVFQCSASGCVSTPIDLGVDSSVYVTLYGTGIRNRSLLSSVRATANGVAVPVLYAGPQPQYPGLDQVNIQLPLSLRGAGEADVVVTVDGRVSNSVTLNVR